MLTWTVEYKGQKERIALFINKVLGLGIVLREGKIIKKTFKIFRENTVEFEFNNNLYSIQITEDNFEFSGVLKVNREVEFQNEIEVKEEIKAPWYGYILMIFTIIIPIVSVESITTWVIGILSSCAVFKVSKLKDKGIKQKLIYSIIIILVAWFLYYLKYQKMKSFGISGGFIAW
ncbi:hypothetical protein [Clostridium cellulovorans]|uniref:Uncharacterized protein n=1 Tax=Clostridium cellulovorans (strain ATCC 35296 / DSM 3052 / OCM 3 / 743B) TaxID=573061 RepID=D9SVH9_CLOC7|nr:hypothetical protein [Clostridium cellulovorans]ADL51103.1 hypothetical protein Clocel_1350 [Clostridium cellulovorans 743B]